jgi:protocatechuate 3,4-dioxygenase beta subunit
MHAGPISLGDTTVVAELRARLSKTEPDRLDVAVSVILDHAIAALDRLKPSEAEFDSLLHFLTDVGYATDARRQEWVLLADIFGLSHLVEGGTAQRNPRITPSTLAGPFYRPDAPRMEQGANLCRDGIGAPLTVTCRVTSAAGDPVCGADVEVWHANGKGRYENQDPDSQPEHNLRGRFVTDDAGHFAFRTVRPGGYTLPDDGPVGRLARRLGLSMDRPAHIHFAVSAPGHRRLVTAIFDGSDPAIERDALFDVKPDLIGTFRSDGAGHSLDVTLVIDREASAVSTLIEKG